MGNVNNEHTVTEANRKIVEQCMAAKFSQIATANVLGIEVETLLKHYQDDIERGSDRASHRLLAAQWKNAEEGENPTLQIWLGKQYLGQREPKEDKDFRTPHQVASDAFAQMGPLMAAIGCSDEQVEKLKTVLFAGIKENG